MEIWKSVNEYYQVSDLGRIKSLKYGRETIMTGGLTSSGYHCVTFLVNKNQSTKATHRLVAEYFVDNPDNLPCVNHKNGIKTDNRAVNIEWCSYKHNSQHAVKNGLIKSGEKSYKAIHSEDTIRKIFHLKDSGMQRKDILDELGISIHVYKDVIKRKSWKHLIIE